MKKLLLFTMLLTLLPLSSANAIKISYSATKLDTENLWQFDYYVSDYVFNEDYGFQIIFEYNLYKDITSLPLTHPNNWDVVVFQPALILDNPDNGSYDAQSKTASASLLDPFSLKFVWLGADAKPNGQFFETYDPDFKTIETGKTTPVPEPATLLLLCAGLSCILLRNKLSKA